MLLQRIGIVVVFCIAQAFAAESAWPRFQHDVAEAPALVRGELSNGLNYLMLPNATPKDHVSLRLIVAAGSRHETDSERGLAHFVEHMAFRGTRGYPNGSTEALQRLGIALGPDSTAFTGYDYTIYHLELPDAKPAMLREGLRVLHEYATAVTFEPKSIERERGVVLSEMAQRDVPTARAGDFRLEFLWPNARETARKPIGLAGQIRTFSRAQCVAFYDAWYRPERMALVAVGAIEPAALAETVREIFGADAGRAPAPVDPIEQRADAASRPTVDVFSDAGLIGISLSLDRPRHQPIVPSTREQRAGQLRETLSLAMLNARLQRRASHPDSPFLSPLASVSAGVRDWTFASIAVAGRLDNWKRAAAALEQEHRRAYQFGFAQSELDEMRAALAANLEQAVRSASTLPSAHLAQQLVGTAVYGSLFLTPDQIEAELKPELDRVTREECLQAFRRVWGTVAPHVLIVAHPSFKITRQEIAAVLNESRQTPVTAPAETSSVEFAYPDFGAAGTLVRDEDVRDLDVRLARFANGVALNFKPTEFEANTVHINVRVGDGQLSQLKSRPGLQLLAEGAFIDGGLGRHTVQELREILVRRTVQLNFDVESDALAFRATCPPRDVPLALAIIGAFITDPAYRPEAVRDTQARINGMHAALAASPGGPIQMRAAQMIFGDDSRFGIATSQEFYGRTLDELRAWFEPQLKSGPIEISVVGDIGWETTRDAVARTLGALPERAPLAVKPPLVPIMIATPPARGVPVYFPIDPKLGQQALAWYWVVPSVASISEERRCVLLAAALAERLRARLREEVGATYAPSAAFVHTNGFPNANYFVIYAEVASARVKQATEVVAREMTAIAKSGVSADEFDRVKQPYLRAKSDDLRTNAYWGRTVLSDVQQRPDRLGSARSRAADNAAITRAEINQLARRMLAPTQAFKFATVPLLLLQTAAPPAVAPSSARPAPATRSP